MPPRTSSSKQLTTTTHQDTRKNIPTEELRDFVAEEENNPGVMRYPRDPSLDPQLVWKGKDEQDGEDLTVPVVPIYIQEKIHPQAIIEDLRRHPSPVSGGGAGGGGQLSLFAETFNGLDFDQLIEFYQHEQHWSNRMILGDSLQVMASLAEKEGLKGQVQMIYLDPPYGIKFGSNWQVSTRKRQVEDGKVEDLTRQPEQVKAFRDTWELGIHSYLSYLRDRLVVARELLTESGSVFVQIGDENVHLVRSLLDEVFGSENFLSLISYQTSVGLGSEYLDNVSNYLLWYGKNRDVGTKYRTPFKELSPGDKGATRYNYALSPDGEDILVSSLDEEDYLAAKGWRLFTDQGLTSRTGSLTTTFTFEFQGEKYKPTAGGWRTNFNGMRRVSYSNRILKAGQTIRFRKFFDDFGCIGLTNQWDDVSGGVSSRSDPKVYVVQTATKIVERCLLMATDPGDLVLDPTCGSGTTAFVAEQWGRRWITMDTSRVALALARTRLMSSVFPYFQLADSPEGVEKTHLMRGQIPPRPLPKTNGDIRQGFVYKQVPHITLRDIANNEEIDALHAKWQEQIEPVLKALTGFGKLSGLLEWELPRTPGEDWSQAAKDLLAKYWSLRRQRQAEIDASIARNSQTETLYDQPYEDNKKVRVTGPFTVESLSPHRMIAPDEPRPASETTGQQAQAGGFVGMILDNLRKAGVQNTKKNERLKFDWLEPFPGEWIQAEGEYTETSPSPSEGEGLGVRSRRAAIAIGPEHGTVGPQMVKEAAKEAVRGVGFDLLIVCGFAFDPHVSEEVKRYGNLTILPTRMNPDLAMGDTLLKKTGSGNLFMVFGEPDMDIRSGKDGITVEIKGLDIYDPTTGQIRSNTTREIAAWFIDTNYNEESFFVRHAYFTGDDKPYERLQRTLRAEINEEAWATLYQTQSRPFPKPETGKIAVKVINHYGDEVLKVYEV